MGAEVILVYLGLIVLDLIVYPARIHAVGECSNSLISCLRPRTGELMTDWERKNVDIGSLTQAYELIESHLNATVDSVELTPNFSKVKELLDDESKAKAMSIKSGRKFWRKPESKPFRLSEQLESSDYLRGNYDDQEVMVNALLRLMDLQYVRYAYENSCSKQVTDILDENNRIAKDPIGRRAREGPNHLGHIDYMILVVAIDRAQRCTARYVDRIEQDSLARDYYLTSIRYYWNSILQHRMRIQGSGDHLEQAQSVIEQYPREALEFFIRNPVAMQEDEVDIVIELIDQVKASSTSVLLPEGTDRRSREFNWFLVRPCKAFLRELEYEFESLDFDLLFSSVLFKEVRERIRAMTGKEVRRVYYTMCKQLINDKERIERFFGS